MANRIQLRRDTQANWNRVNPILEDGEPGLDITQNKIKYGDGSSTWTELAYASGESTSSSGNTLVNGEYVVSLGADGELSTPGNVRLAPGGRFINDGTIGSTASHWINYPDSTTNWFIRIYEDEGANLKARLGLENLSDITIETTGNIAGMGGDGPDYKWTFGGGGTLTLPGDIVFAGGGYIEDSEAFFVATDGGFQIQTNKTAGQKTWDFGDDGTLATPGNVTIGSGYGNISMVHTISANNFVYANGVSILDGVGSSYGNTEVAAYLASGNLQTAQIHGNLTVGNLTVNGSTTTISTNSYVVTDNIVQFADGNPADTLDLGFVAHRTVGGTLEHTGFVRDASANNWKLFSNITTQPGTTVDFANVIYDDIVVGNISSPTIDSLIANAAVQAGLIANAQGNYSNANVASYLGNVSTNINPVPNDIWGLGAENKEWYSAHIKNAYIKETIQAYSGGGYSGGNAGELLKSTGSGIAWQELKTVNGNSLFGNGDITISTYSNANVASYLTTYTGNITATNITATGNVTANIFVSNTITGAVANANTTITAGSYTSTFDTAGNVALPGNVTVGGLGVTMPTRPAFRVNGTGLVPQTLTANVNLKGAAITVAYNQGSYFDSTTGKFTAPIAGIYSVGLNARVGTLNAASQIAVLKNGNNTSGNIVCFWETDTNTGTAVHFGVNGTVQLAVGEYLSANILQGNITFDNNDNWHVTYLG